MEFRTIVNKPEFPFKVTHAGSILTLGSCFADVAGAFLVENKFFAEVNPFGTVYNLQSIRNLLAYTLGNIEVEDEGFVERDGMFFHYNFHSDWAEKDRDSFVSKFKETRNRVGRFCQSAQTVMLTLGTSWVYEKEGQVVSNCHKIPAKSFTKRLLDLEEQKTIFREILGLLFRTNSGINVVLSVSPVRHIKDGLEENQVSKAILRLLCDWASREFENVYYFPSYEIMMDDLRDYRFYKQDLIHPSAMAEEYIMDVFSKAFFSEETQELISRWTKIRMALNHRPFNPDTPRHQSFLVNLHSKIEAFSSFLDVREELAQVQKQII